MFQKPVTPLPCTAVILVILRLALAGNVPIRIVRETATFGGPFVTSISFLVVTSAFGSNFQVNSRDQILVAKSKPEEFTGPSHLKRLLGKCFSFSTSDYRYTLCPFQNITQVEDSYRWNAYRGVLGVWQGWTISNGTFASMAYAKGDSCGASERSVQVTLTCGDHGALLNVSEPQRCKYVATFSTPLVCSDDALLVYPRLNATLRQRWNDVENQRFNDELTQKGYETELNKIFEEAGFLKLPKDETAVDSPQAASQVTHNTARPQTRHTNITICNAEYEQLQAEISRLQMSLEFKRKGGGRYDT